MVKDMLLTKNGKLLGKGGKSLSVRDSDGVIYKSDFSQFSLSTGVDIPKIGNPTTWILHNTNGMSVGIITIDGREYSCLSYSDGYNGQINFPIDQIGLDIFSLEADVFVPSYNSTDTGGLEIGGSNLLVVSPYYNTYQLDRGIMVKMDRVSERYNGFTHVTDTFYGSNYYDRWDFSKILTGGITVDKINGKIYTYLFGKKATGRAYTVLDYIDLYFNSANARVLEFRIYNKNRFEEME